VNDRCDRGHVNCYGRDDVSSVCFRVQFIMAFLLERLAETVCGDTRRNIRDDLRQIKLAQFLAPQGELWQVTDPLPAAAKHLNN